MVAPAIESTRSDLALTLPFRFDDGALAFAGAATQAPTSPEKEEAPPAVVIQLDNVRVSFREGIVAVNDASLIIRRGEFVSLVGPSGCGKTTLLNIIAGLVERTSYTGRSEIVGNAPMAGNRDIAYMLARDALCPWLSAKQNVELANRIRGVDKKTCRSTALRLLDAVGLGNATAVYPKELSHGMRQRVALARTFSLDAPVLLMDEPFGALDVFTKIQLADVLLDLWGQERKTILFVTHDLSEAVGLSDRVVVMGRNPGRIIADIAVPLERPRSMKELQKDPLFHKLLAEVWQTLEGGLGE